MYALIINQRVEKHPYSISELRKDNPQVSFPKNLTDDLLKSFNVIKIQPTDCPTYDIMSHRIEQGQPVFSNDQWIQSWNVVSLTDEEIAQQQKSMQELIVAYTQQHLDEFAHTRNYDGIMSATTYANSPSPKFAIEGRYCIEVRDATWSRLYEIFDEVKNGLRSMPKEFADIKDELPQLLWPND